MRRWVTSPAYRAVAELVVKSRAERGWTQRQLATALGVPPSVVAKIEIGERRLDVVEFVKLARVLGIDPSELWGRLAPNLPERLEF